MSDGLDETYKVASFLDKRAAAWCHHFPHTLRRAHQPMLEIVRASADQDDGVPFSKVCGRMGDMFGMDSETCKIRVGELARQGFLNVEDTSLRARTFITATPILISSYDSYASFVANDLVDSFMGDGSGCGRDQFSTNTILLSVAAKWESIFERGANAFLRNHIYSRSLRQEAYRDLITFPYWRIYSFAWLSSDHGIGEIRAFLILEDVHFMLYKVMDISSATTKSYIKDLISWGFLRRLSAKDGIKYNKFAFRMSDEAFASFSNMYADLFPVLHDAAAYLAAPQYSSPHGFTPTREG